MEEREVLGFEGASDIVRSGGFPGKCEKLEKDLRGMSKARGLSLDVVDLLEA